MKPQTWLGKTLNNRYRVDEFLGQGGMSTVYKGHDPHLDRPVAIKIIHTYLAVHERFLSRFRQEAAAVARLRHPHIVQVYDFDQSDEQTYMVMEFVPGETLRSLLAGLDMGERGRFTISDIARLMSHLCGAVDYAHRQDMIHRDLKPANVMIRQDGEPVLMDFGIAKLLDRSFGLTSTGAVMGTVAYMSPEQVRGDPIDHRADIYALGVMLYEMLTGSRPFEAETQFATMMKHLHDPVPQLMDAIEVDDGRQLERLATIIDRALAKDREARFPSALLMEEALRGVLAVASGDDTTMVRPVASAQTHEIPRSDSPLAARDHGIRRILDLEQRLAKDPFSEEAERELMLLLARRGEFVNALRRFAVFQETLQADLGIEPQPETVAVRERILSARLAPEHNLQPDVTPFVGRAAELERILSDLLEPSTRLLTLTGSGGMGKTRLARAVIRALGESGWRFFLHGAFFVPLAAVESDEELFFAIARACDIPPAGQADPLEQLQIYFKAREMLLVLDNFEHLTPSAKFVHNLLEAAPGLKCLVTSRTRLNVAGETIFPVVGLNLSSPVSEPADTAELDDGTRLFLQASRKLDPSFTLDDGDQQIVRRICSAVAGMPLAIELAASWTRLLTCAEIAGRLEEDFNLLASDQVGLPTRHHTLRALFTYSWSLLDRAGKESLAGLSVFRNRFDFAAAAAVTGVSLGQIRGLVDNSLLEPVLIDNLTRTPLNAVYAMHETVRVYAAEKLTENPDRSIAIRRAHAGYYLDFLAAAGTTLLGPEQRVAWTAIAADFDNVRLAWQTATRDTDHNGLGGAINGLHIYLIMGGLVQEGLQLFSTALEQLPPDASSATRLRLQGRVADFLVRLARYTEAERLCELCLVNLDQIETAKREAGLGNERAFLLGVLAEAKWRQGLFAEAGRLVTEGQALCRANDDRYGLAALLNQEGVIQYLQGDFPRAYGTYWKSLELFDEMGNELNAARLRANLALYQVAMKQYEEGIQGLRADLDVARVWQNKPKMAVDLLNLAWAELALNRLDPAREYVEESLIYYREVGDREGEATALIIQGQIAWEEGQKAMARRLFTRGLQLSMDVLAIPKALECVASLALILSEERPADGWALARFVSRQPQANQMVHSRSEAVFVRLDAVLTAAEKEDQDRQAGGLTLEAVAAVLLAEGGA